MGFFEKIFGGNEAPKMPETKTPEPFETAPLATNDKGEIKMTDEQKAALSSEKILSDKEAVDQLIAEVQEAEGVELVKANQSTESSLNPDLETLKKEIEEEEGIELVEQK